MSLLQRGWRAVSCAVVTARDACSTRPVRLRSVSRVIGRASARVAAQSAAMTDERTRRAVTSNELRVDVASSLTQVMLDDVSPVSGTWLHMKLTDFGQQLENYHWNIKMLSWRLEKTFTDLPLWKYFVSLRPRTPVLTSFLHYTSFKIRVLIIKITKNFFPITTRLSRSHSPSALPIYQSLCRPYLHHAFKIFGYPSSVLSLSCLYI